MTLDARQHEWAIGRDLRQVAPGFYVDETGTEYFYLTALCPCVAQRLLKNPLLNTATFVSDVLYELRCALENLYYTELMD